MKNSKAEPPVAFKVIEKETAWLGQNQNGRAVDTFGEVFRVQMMNRILVHSKYFKYCAECDK